MLTNQLTHTRVLYPTYLLIECPGKGCHERSSGGPGKDPSEQPASTLLPEDHGEGAHGGGVSGRLELHAGLNHVGRLGENGGEDSSEHTTWEGGKFILSCDCRGVGRGVGGGRRGAWDRLPTEHKGCN